MTSPDFMYPQPTDDELAAQQPLTPPIGSRVDEAASIDREGPANRWHGQHPNDGRREHDQEPSAGPDSRLDETRANPLRLGRIALALTIIAGAVSLGTSFILGITIGPAEAEHGSYFADAPGWYRGLATGLLGLQALCTAVGITGLVIGIVAAVTGGGRTQGITAAVLALVAPLTSFAVFIVLSFTFA